MVRPVQAMERPLHGARLRLRYRLRLVGPADWDGIHAMPHRGVVRVAPGGCYEIHALPQERWVLVLHWIVYAMTPQAKLVLKAPFAMSDE